MDRRIPTRCVHCGDCLPGWHPWHQRWGECADCRAWQRYLWQQRPPVLRLDPALNVETLETVR